uniref:Uncharacterized protein n=1 Tax=Euplotes harpa TaxID=151035 RepID=A0A7S3J3Y2_9SPIT|mmetsp:Transcript_18685/g.21472  ORF Transcript_18685/g.21472 Transcript_18685/m.21472 type:complete len:128 (+) Transcript_18685:224-607(+)|eukprot:CAMPEP_0168342718 /NCGR_PEP_ID=MMETSP0213-20121227/15577_1 /TAXON_ID=151035 /ORGANISM="Euplotes harpa, Strain FSP1.4" /LENGTH=127 /DNA_ID=CAMNT_0008349701 /DNA_START=217 /DNA_END=600 /DNA_ORIENTATION=+
MWGGCFSSFDCLMIWYRQKDDPWNAVVSGFLTGGVLAIRGGANLAFKNALIGGVILGLIEGISIIMQSVMARRQFMMIEQMQKEQIEKMKLAAAQQRNPWEVNFDEKESYGTGGFDGSKSSGTSYSF